MVSNVGPRLYFTHNYALSFLFHLQSQSGEDMVEEMDLIIFENDLKVNCFCALNCIRVLLRIVK